MEKEISCIDEFRDVLDRFLTSDSISEDNKEKLLKSLIEVVEEVR